MDEHRQLELAFLAARGKATAFIEGYNARLPTSACPACGDGSGHVPGLRCPACGYRHETAWAIIRDSEWGYEVIPLTNRRHVIASFVVELGPDAS